MNSSRFLARLRAVALSLLVLGLASQLPAQAAGENIATQTRRLVLIVSDVRFGSGAGSHAAPAMDYFGQPRVFTRNPGASLLPAADAGIATPGGTNQTSTRRILA